MKKEKDRKVIKMGLSEAVLVICVLIIAAVLLIGVIIAALKRQDNLEALEYTYEEGMAQADSIIENDIFDKEYQIEGNQYVSSTGTVVILTDDGKVYARIGEQIDIWGDASVVDHVNVEDISDEREEIRSNVSQDRILITDEEIVAVYFPIKANAIYTEEAFVKTKTNRYLLVDLVGMNVNGELINRGKNPLIVAEAKDLVGKDVIGINKSNNGEYIAILEDNTTVEFNVLPITEKREVNKTTTSFKEVDIIAEECVKAILNGEWEVIAEYSEYAYLDEDISAMNKYLKPVIVTKELDETIYTDQANNIYVYKLQITVEEISQELVEMNILFEKDDTRFLTIEKIAGEWKVSISTEV